MTKKRAQAKTEAGKPLAGQVAVVAGATRGAGRGIACMLGEAGATVYCTGRSVRGNLATTGPWAGRPETIDETAEMVTSYGGVGIAVRVDHTVAEEVSALFARVGREHGRLDVLVNDISGGAMGWKPFWKHDVEHGITTLDGAINAHLITSRYGAPFMVEQQRGLIVEVTEGDLLNYHQDIFVDLAKIGAIRMAYDMAEDLYKHRVTALALTPGYMRSEAMLDGFGVTQETWREAAKKDPNFLASETPFFVGRAVAALAADARVHEKSGGVYTSWGLAREYGFTDVDGSRPDWGKHFDEHVKAPYGWPPRTGWQWTLSRLPEAKSSRRPRKSGSPA